MSDDLQLPIDDELSFPAAPADDEDLDACDRLPAELARILDEIEQDDD